MTNQAEIIGDETIREIASLYPRAARAVDDDTPPEVAAMLTHIPALCATVKHLRAELAATKDHWANTSEDLTSALLKRDELQSQLEQLRAEIEALRKRVAHVETCVDCRSCVEGSQP